MASVHLQEEDWADRLKWRTRIRTLVPLMSHGDREGMNMPSIESRGVQLSVEQEGEPPRKVGLARRQRA